MKRIFALLLLFLPFFMAKSQVLSIDNGIFFTNTKYTPGNVFKNVPKSDLAEACNSTNYAVMLSFDYFKMKKYFYITTQVGYFATGYNTYQYNYLHHIVDTKVLNSSEMHFSLSFRGKRQIFNNMFVYAGLGPKLDYSFDYKKKIEDHVFPNINMFRNMFGGKFDLGVYMDISKNYRVGINTAYLTNFNNGDKILSNKIVCGLSVGYIFRQSSN